MRLHFMNHTNILSLVTCNPFDAITENVITLMTNSRPSSNYIPYYNYNQEARAFVRYESMDIDYCKTNKYNEMVLGLTSEIISILQKMHKGGIALGQISESKRGAEVSKNFLREEVTGLKTLIGQDMKKYAIFWNSTYLSPSHKEYRRLKQFFDSELLYLRRVDSMLEATISQSYRFGFNKNVYGIKLKTPCLYDIRYVLACINSKALDFYYKKKFSTKKADVFPEIQTYLYEQLPIYAASIKQQQPIIDLVDKILFIIVIVL